MPNHSPAFQAVAIDLLQPGSFVVAVSRQTGDVLIKDAGWVRSVAIIAELKRKGVLEVLIDPSRQLPASEPASAPTDAAPASTSEPASSKLRAAFDSERVKAEACLQSSKKQTSKLLQQLADGTEPALQPQLQQCDKLLQSCQRNPQVLLYLQQILQDDDALLRHSLRCACLMAAFCSQLSELPVAAPQLVLAALLHDCGKVQLQQLFPDEQASEAQILPYSLALLQQLPDAGELSDIVAGHLERADRQPAACQLLAIVNSYANLQQQVDDGRLSAPLLPQALLQQTGQRLDAALTDKFLQILGLYPPGTAVRLRSGKLALVLENHPRFLDKPRVKLFYHSLHKHHLPAKVIDLARQSDDQISGAADLRHYALDLQQYF